MQEIFTRRSEVHELIISRNSDFLKNKDGGEEEEEEKTCFTTTATKYFINKLA